VLERHLHLKTGLFLLCGVALSLLVFFLIKDWEEGMRFNTFKQLAAGHGGAIQMELAHVGREVGDVRFLIEHGINLEHKNPLHPKMFMPLAEARLIHDADLLSIGWLAVKNTAPQALTYEAKNLQALYVKQGENHDERVDIDELKEDYAEYLKAAPAIENSPLVRVFVDHKKEVKGNELTFIAPVANRMQSGTRFLGRQVGALVVEWSLEGLIERALASQPVAAQDVSLFLLHEGGKDLIYKHMSRSRGVDELYAESNLHSVLDFDFSGRHWQLAFDGAPEFLRQHRIVLAWPSLIFGLLLTLLFVWYMRIEARQLERVEQQVLERTAELKKSKRKVLRIIDNLQDVYYEADKEGVIQTISASIYDASGYTVDEVTGTQLADYYVDPDGRRKFMQALSASGNGKIYDYELELRQKDGGTKSVSCNAQFLYDDDGQVRGVEGTVRDISEKKQREQEREQMNQQLEYTQRLESLGVLAGGIAHNFNNILAIVMGYASEAEFKLPEHPHDAKKDMGKITQAAERAADLCQQILAYVGKNRISIEALNLSELIGGVADLLDVANAKHVHMTYQLQDHLPLIKGDKGQIRQVIMNIVSNACEAVDKTEKSGDVCVSTGVMQVDEGYLQQCIGAENPAAGAYVYIKVADSGCGMDAETITKIFDPFFTTNFIGRGLGLSAGLGIVKTHGGLIRCDSEIDGGTVFYVLFPVSTGVE